MKKKTILMMIVISLCSNSIFGAPAWWNTMTMRLQKIPGGIKRTWHCATKPGVYKCSPEERKRALAWVAGAGALLATILIGAGIKVTQAELKKQQELAKAETGEQLREIARTGTTSRELLFLIKKHSIFGQMEPHLLSTRIQGLISRGADVNIQDEGGKTPLMLALTYQMPKVTEELLKAPRIDLNLTDKNGNSALSIAASRSLSLVNELLKKGANPNIGNPLANASDQLQDSIAIFKALLKAGANPRAPGLFHPTVLEEYAALVLESPSPNRKDILKLLKEADKKR